MKPMTNSGSYLFGFLLLAATNQTAIAADCSDKLQQRAVATLPAASAGWTSLRRHHNTFAACDDGELAEGYSDAVARLFARRWKTSAELLVQPQSFQRWAIRHIDGTASRSDLQAIQRHTRVCNGRPATVRICAALRHAATSALLEQAGAR